MEAAMLLVPALTALIYGEAACVAVFLGSALFCLLGGHLLKGKKPDDVTIFLRKAMSVWRCAGL